MRQQELTISIKEKNNSCSGRKLICKSKQSCKICCKNTQKGKNEFKERINNYKVHF